MEETIDKEEQRKALTKDIALHFARLNCDLREAASLGLIVEIEINTERIFGYPAEVIVLNPSLRTEKIYFDPFPHREF